MKKFILFTLIIAAFISCRKDPPEVCNTDLASVSGSYKISGYTYKGGPQFPEIPYTQDIFPDSCDRDNIYKFSANGSYQIMDVGLSCMPSGNDTGTWQFISANS